MRAEKINLSFSLINVLNNYLFTFPSSYALKQGITNFVLKKTINT